MITHIVLFRFAGTDEERRTAAVEGRRRLEGMVGRVPPIRSLAAGVDVVHSPRSADLALTVTFDSLENLAAYQDHPDHVEVATWLRERADAIVACDYEG